MNMADGINGLMILFSLLSIIFLKILIIGENLNPLEWLFITLIIYYFLI